MDPKVWKEPDQFKLERFLDSEGEVQGADRILPYSLGMGVKEQLQCLIKYISL